MALVCTRAHAATKGPYQENAVYLARVYVASAAWQGEWLDQQLELFAQRGVRVLAVNVGDMMPDGNLSGGCERDSSGRCLRFTDFTTCSAGHAAGLLARIHAFELSHPWLRFEVLAWLNNGYMGTPGDRVDLDRLWNQDHSAVIDNPVQTTVARNALRFVSPSGDCATQARQFDGVLYDFEPTGIAADPYPDPLLPDGVSNQFEGIKETVIKTSNAFAPYGAKVAIAAHGFRASPASWSWTSAQYYYMGLYADYLFAMTYDSGSTNATAYAGWIVGQANAVIDAVSGVTLHAPEPARQPRVFFGLPAFGPDSVAHRVSAETITVARNNPARALLSELSRRCAVDARFCRYVRGASLYLHRSGYVCNTQTQGASACERLNPFGRYDEASGASFYASEDDWVSWGVYWLAKE